MKQICNLSFNHFQLNALYPTATEIIPKNTIAKNAIRAYALKTGTTFRKYEEVATTIDNAITIAIARTITNSISRSPILIATIYFCLIQ